MNNRSVEKVVTKLSSRNKYLRGLCIFAARYLIMILAALLLGLIAWFSPTPLWSAAEVFGVLLITWGVTTLLQFLFARHRPFDSGIKPLIKPWIKSPSFPSGHSSISFAAATYGTLFFPEWGIFLFPIAAIVAFSRLAVGVHYLSDIVVGSGFGVVVAISLKIMFNLGT